MLMRAASGSHGPPGTTVYAPVPLVYKAQDSVPRSKPELARIETGPMMTFRMPLVLVAVPEPLLATHR